MGDNLTEIDLGSGRTVSQLAIGVRSNGSTHACAVLDNSTLKCWGYNGYAQLGLETTTGFYGNSAGQMGDNLDTVALGTGRSPVQIAGGEFFTCAILDNDTTKCWGQNNYGELGQEHTTQEVGDAIGEMGDNLPVTSL